MIACDGEYQQRVAYRAPVLRGAISETFDVILAAQVGTERRVQKQLKKTILAARCRCL